MTSNRKFLVAASASALAIAAIAGAASAQTPVFGGSDTGGPGTQVVTNGDSNTTTTGDSTEPPYTTTATTVTNQTVATVTAPTTTAVSGTVNGNAYTGTITVEGAGAAQRTETTALIQTYDPGPPPTVKNSVTTPPIYSAPTNEVTTKVVANGSAGDAGLIKGQFAATLSTGDTITDNTVVATENDITTGTTGTTYATYVGTAAYDASKGNVVVTLPTTATNAASYTSTGMTVSDAEGNATSVTSTGVTVSAGETASTLTATGLTTGTVVANSVTAGSVTTGTLKTGAIDMTGGQIHNLGNGTAQGDAVNLYQLQAGMNNLRKVAAGGTAVAAALSGSYFIPGKKLNVSINLADYGAQGAFAANIGYLITPSIALNAGVATGFEYGATAGRIGATMGF